MNRRGFAQGSFFCTLVTAVLAGSPCTAQDSSSCCDDLGSCSISGDECAGCLDDACGWDDCCQSWLTARAGLLYMKRESLDNVPILTNGGGSGPVVLSGSDFDFGYEPGGEVSLIFGSSCLPASFEFRYFQIGNWTSNQPATTLSSGVINTTPNASVSNPMDYARYRSQLYGFELNARKQVSCNLTLLAGFRYVSFDEDLDILFNGFDQFWWGIENDLFGFQVGAEAVLYDNCCGFRIEGFAKAGLYGNDAKISNQALLMSEQDVSERSGMDHLAFVAELGLMGAYDLSCCWTVRAGYQVMWLDGVLVAANQVSGTDDQAVTVAYNYTDVIFHGAKLELERRW